MPKIAHHAFVCILLFFSVSCRAAVVIVPGAPNSAQDTHIQVVNQYGPATSILGYTVSAASVVSSSIARSGDQFSIALLVDVVCPGSPANLTLTADFDVGALRAGTYQVVAQITHRSHFPACGGPLVTQASSFAVVDAELVVAPTGNTLGYFIAGYLLVLFAARNLKNQGLGKRDPPWE